MTTRYVLNDVERTKRSQTLWLGFVLLAVLACFAPTIGFDFVRWDDPQHVLGNPLIVSPESVPWYEYITTPALGYPVPLPVLTYRVEHALVGLRVPGLYHATNVFLHLCACALSFSIARRVGLSIHGAALGALVFGLHPAAAESVSWVSGRKDLLALVFALVSVLCALPGNEAHAGKRFGSVIAFALALLSKPVAVFVLPVVVSMKRRTCVARFSLPYVLLALTILPVAMAGQSAVGAIRTGLGLGSYLREAWYALGHHIGIIAFVHEPTAKYVPDSLAFSPVVDLAPLAFAFVLWLIFASLDARRRPIAALALVFMVASYLPSSSLVPLVRYLADTYVYPSLVGLGWLVGACFDVHADRVSSRVRRARALLPVIVAAMLAIATVPSSARFHDSVSLWSHAYARYPDDFRLCQNASLSHYDVGGARDVLRATDLCIARFGPEEFEKNRAIALYRLGRIEEALVSFERAASRRTRAGVGADPVIAHYLARIAQR